ncbi:MAG: sulfite exporter TauE/SafE family protein, partial [Candidatus Eisenbacteria bacterium]
MPARDRVRGLLAGAVAGTAGGLFGVGGGILLVPILTGFFGLTQHQAHGTSLAVIGAAALAALIVYGAHANVVWTTAALVALGSLVSARFGARWATRVSARGLRHAFAVFLLLVAARLLWEAPAVTDHRALAGTQGFAFSLLLGLAVGTLAGFMGVGGGILIVPACTL